MATKGAIALAQKSAVDRLNDATERIANAVGLTRQQLARRNRRNPRMAGLDEVTRLEVLAEFLEDVADTIAPQTQAVPADPELDALEMHEDGTINYDNMTVEALNARIDRLALPRDQYGVSRDARRQDIIDMMYAVDANIDGARFESGERAEYTMNQQAKPKGKAASKSADAVSVSADQPTARAASTSEDFGAVETMPTGDAADSGGGLRTGKSK